MKGSVCKRTYHRTRGMKLQNTAEGIRAGVFNNIDVFKIPPTTKKAFTNTINNYTNKRIAHDMGGSAQNAYYVVARKKLMELIDDFADYVDNVAKCNPAIIHLAGFMVAYDSHKYRPKRKPDNIRNLVLKNHDKLSGVLLSYCETYSPRTYFMAILLAGSPLPEGLKIFRNETVDIPDGFEIPIKILANKSRNKIITGLTPGIRYYLYYVAYNNHGCSELSNCVNVMCG